jgi:Sec63 Brl domain/Helicase conserved C-terminal domain
MPNVSDIAAFLNASNAFVFDDSYRPVPLTTHVALCGDAGKNQFLFNKNMNQRVPGVIRQFSKGKPTIIFCHTKKESETLASELSHNSNLGFSINNPKLASQTSVIALQRCLLRGVAYHNAGLDILDRKLVEKAFLEGHIRCLCATSTLSVGVNLPAHLVVIKGTSAWRGSEVGYVEVDKGSLLQMIGRAGRMGFDTSGTAVIMTESKFEKRYKELGNNIDFVESQLLPKLVQVFNHEISLKVITDFHSAKNWLATTFLFQRIKGNPNSVGLSKDADTNFCLTKICGTELKKLEDAGLISVCKESGEISPLFACDIMNQHLVEFSSMKAIIELPFLVNIEHLLQAISRFQGIQKAVRRSDKKVLNELHNTLKYKLETKSKIRIQEPYQKAFVLLQAAIGQHYFEDFTLRQEMSSNLEFATRILAAAEEYSIYGSKNGQVALQCLKLRRCLSVSLWGPGDGVLNQLRGVGQATTQRLRSHNISSFLDVVNTTEDVIDKVAGRSDNFGFELRKAAIAILQNSLKLSAHISDECLIICELSKSPIISTYEEHMNAQESVAVRYTLIAYTDQPNGCLFFQANVEGPGVMSFHCPESFGQISIHLVSSLVGLDDVVIIKGDKENNDPQFKYKSVANKTLNCPQTKNTPDKQQATRPKRLSDLNLASCPRSKRKKVQNNANSGSRNRKATALGPWPLHTSSSLPCHEARTSFINKVSPFSYDTNRIDYANGEGSENDANVESPYVKRYEIVESNCRETRGELSTEEEAFEKQSAIIEDTTGYRMELFDNYVSVENSRSTFSNMKKCSQTRIKTTQKWSRQKREQRAMQSSVFKRKQDNPFQAFQYDPNDAEKNLDLTTNDEDSSLGILPKGVFTKMEPEENYGVKRPIRIRSKKGYACSSINRFDSHTIPAHTLLRMKAEEQQRYTHDYYPMSQNRVHPLLHQESQHSQYPVNGPYILPSSSQHDVLPHLGLSNNFEVPRYMPFSNDNIIQDTFIQNWHVNRLPEEVCQFRYQDLNDIPSEQDFWMRQCDTEYHESMQRDYILARDSLVSRLNTCNSQEIQNGIHGHTSNQFLGDGKHEKKRSYKNYYKAATVPNEVLLDEAFNKAF